MSLNKLNKLLFWLCLIFSSSVWGLASDREQPINIEADSAVIDDAKGLAIYSGNVIVTQGSIRINAEKLTLHYTEKQTLEKAVAEGKPVRFKQTPDNKKPDIQAKAMRMEYYAHKDMLNLTNEAMVWQGEDRFTGAIISYDTKNGVIRAERGKSESGRVSVTIQPRK